VIHEECDYVREGENAEKLRKTFLDSDDVCFPKVYWDRTTETVLTMQRIEGVPFNDLDRLDAEHVDRRAVARAGIVCYYEQIFMNGFYHADPHPGNLFALPDGRVAFTDFGRCGKLSDRARQQVADLLVAIIEQDGQLMADVLLDVSSGGSADTDIAGLQRDVTSLVNKYYDLELHEVDSREMVLEIMSLVGRHGLTMDSEFALLLTTLATIQALGTSVDPDFHFVDSVRPFAERIVEEQLQPASLTRGMAATLRRTFKAAQVFPEQFSRALQRVGDGNLSMTVRPGGFDPLMSRVEHMSDRLAFALVISAFVVGLSTLLARTSLPWWVEYIAYFALICATGVGVFFFLSMVFRRFRQRPPQ
jgi:ubiquinone biosynthesis protein